MNTGVALSRDRDLDTGLGVHLESGLPTPAARSQAAASSDHDDSAVRARDVARVIEYVECIGLVCSALRQVGLNATIAGNRITVNNEVFVQYCGARIDQAGVHRATWAVFGLNGDGPYFSAAEGTVS